MTDTVIASYAVALAAENGQKQTVHLLPAGRFAGRDGRGPWTLSDPHKVIAATRRYAGKTVLPIDYDHQTDFGAIEGVGGRAPAAGWITALRAAPDGIHGHVDWTADAARMIAEKAYRYISPVFRHRRDGEVELLMRAGLTNNPALDLTALCSAGGSMTDTLAGRLRDLAGLPADADDAAVLARLEELTAAKETAAAAPNPADYVPLGDYQRTVQELQQTQRANAESVVDQHIQDGRLGPYMRDWAITLCAADRKAFDQFVEGLGAPWQIMHKMLATPVVPAGKPPGSRSRLTEKQVATCQRFGITEDEFLKHWEG